jgi:hypothetical protein
MSKYNMMIAHVVMFVAKNSTMIGARTDGYSQLLATHRGKSLAEICPLTIT